MITTVLLGLAALFVYLQIGYWLGHLCWWTWRTTERKKRVLTFLLFPISTVCRMTEKEVDLNSFPFNVAEFKDCSEQRVTYFALKSLTWPFSLIWNLLCVAVVSPIILISRRVSQLDISATEAIFLPFFLLTAGPKVLVIKIIDLVRARRLVSETRTRVVEEFVGTAASPLLTSDDRTRAEEYRRLCKECDDLEGQLAPRKARCAEIEVEDAATHDAFRDLPQEMRLPKA